MFTGIQRRLLPSAPLFAIDAPLQGSGKTLLADLVAIMATGRDAVSISVDKDPAELRKRFTSILRAGDAVVSLDNVTKPFDSDALATILTHETFADRLLGESAITRNRTNLLWLITGNNLCLRGDMSSRVIVARLDAGMERPEERGGWAIPNVRAWMQANRPRLIQAVLTILRAYHLAGRPKSGLPVFGRFEEWSDSIREPLVWAGFDDPLLTREAVVNDDPDREKCATLLAAWSQAQGVGEGSTLEKVIATANLLEPCNAHLKAALLAVAANAKGDMVDPNRLAWWCRKQVGRPAEGLVLVKFGKDNHTKKMLWGVEAVTVAEPAEACGPISSANAGESKTDDHTDDHHQTHGNGLEMPPHASAGSANPPPPVAEDHDPQQTVNSVLANFQGAKLVTIIPAGAPGSFDDLQEEAEIDRLAIADVGQARVRV